jgi:hypothetical protein
MNSAIDYTKLVSSFRAGDYGQVALHADESAPAIEQALRIAAQQRGLSLTVIVRRPSWFRFRIEGKPMD